jgi:hypothetical protein
MMAVSVARVVFFDYTLKRKIKNLFMSGWGHSSLMAATAQFSTRAKLDRLITVADFVLRDGDTSVEKMSSI